MRLVAPGYVRERFESTVFLARIFLPAAILVHSGSLLKAVRNSYEEFTIPATPSFVETLVAAAAVAVLAPAFRLWSLAVGFVGGYAGGVRFEDT